MAGGSHSVMRMPAAFIKIPAASTYRLVNARVPIDLAPGLAAQAGPDRFAACEIVVEGGRIAALGPADAAAAKLMPDDGKLVKISREVAKERRRIEGARAAVLRRRDQL